MASKTPRPITSIPANETPPRSIRVTQDDWDAWSARATELGLKGNITAYLHFLAKRDMDAAARAAKRKR